MKEFVEKLINRLEELITDTYYKSVEGSRSAGIENNAYHNVKKIVNQLAEEYKGGWIPCSERLPDKYCHCLVTRRNDYEDGSFDSDVREDVWIELEGVWGWQSKFEGLIDEVIAWHSEEEQSNAEG